MPENGKWQLAFWIVTVAFGAWLGALTTNVIANDRLRVDGDDTTKAYTELRAERNRETIIKFMQENQEAHQKIMIDLQDIKTRLGINEVQRKVS